MAQFRKHKEVILQSDKFRIGGGTLLKVLPEDILCGTKLGLDRVAVLIDDVFELDDDIPYPVGNVVKMCDAKDLIVSMGYQKRYVPWTRSVPTEAPALGRDVQTPVHRGGNVSYNSVPDSQEDANVEFCDARVQDDFGVDDGVRGSEQVCLYTRSKMVARGIVCDHVHHKHMGKNKCLEDGQIYVKVTRVLEPSEACSFPTEQCNTMGEAIHLDCIIWKAAFVVYIKDPIAIHEDQKSFSVGDDIHLQLNGINVARGEVFQTNPLDKVHNISLGFNQISIQVLEAFHSTTRLPYPSAGADTIGEAIGSYVIWDVDDVCEVSAPFDDETFQNIHKEDEQNSSTEDRENMWQDDFTDRSKWHLKDVEIFNTRP